LIIQDRDGSLMTEPFKKRLPQSTEPSYRVEIPAGLLDEQSSLIDRIIAFAFDWEHSAWTYAFVSANEI